MEITTKIILPGGYVITVDDLNHSLYKERIAQKGKSAGKSFLDPIGYFPNLRSALERYLKNFALDNMSELDYSLMDYVSAYEDITERAANELAIMFEKGNANNGNL